MTSTPSETVRSADYAICSSISMLLEYLGGSDGKLPYKRLADDLSKVAKKHPPWSRRYILSVHRGTVGASNKLERAVFQLGLFYDGLELIAGAYKVEVLSHDESIAGAYVMGAVKVCPKCSARFVPSIVWRKYCPSCSPPVKLPDSVEINRSANS